MYFGRKKDENRGRYFTVFSNNRYNRRLCGYAFLWNRLYFTRDEHRKSLQYISDTNSDWNVLCGNHSNHIHLDSFRSILRYLLSIQLRNSKISNWCRKSITRIIMVRLRCNLLIFYNDIRKCSYNFFHWYRKCLLCSLKRMCSLEDLIHARRSQNDIAIKINHFYRNGCKIKSWYRMKGTRITAVIFCGIFLCYASQIITGNLIKHFSDARFYRIALCWRLSLILLVPAEKFTVRMPVMGLELATLRLYTECSCHGVPVSSRTTVPLGWEVNHSWEMINI